MKKRAARMRKKGNLETNILAVSSAPALTSMLFASQTTDCDSFSLLCGKLHCPAERTQNAQQRRSAISHLQV